MNKVVIYGASWCTYCEQAKQLANSKGMLVDYRSMDDPHHRTKFQEKFPGINKIPQIILNGRMVGGFDQFATVVEQEYDNFGQGPF